MAHNSKSTLIALKKARTSLDKIIKMVEDDQYCIDIIQQNLAVLWLIKSANLQLLEWHLNCCFVDAMKKNDQSRIETMIQELLNIVKTAQNK